MKRIISFFLVLVMALPFTACNQIKGLTTNKVPTETATPIETTTPTEGATPSEATTPTKTVAHQEISWDLSSIYPDGVALEKEFSQAMHLIKVIAALRGKLSTVDGVISYYEGIDEAERLLGRLNAYTMLQVYKDQSDSAAKARSGRVNLATKLSIDTAFALPELLANNDSFLDTVAKDSRMKPYLTRFYRDRVMSTYTLSESEEQLLQPVYQLRAGAYSLYFTLVYSDLTFQNIKFPDGSERPADNNNYPAACNKEYPQEFRIAYSNAMMQPYNQFRNTLAQNMHNYYTAVTQSAASHKYSSALEASLIPENTPISVYHGVLSAANQAKPVLDRYFTLLKKSLGVTTLYSFETNVSIAKDPGTEYSYLDAQKLVKEALAPLGEDYVKRLDVMLSGDAIDVYPAEKKTTGAFTMPIPGTHPYILLNYTNDFDSISSLTHELGHAVHVLYSQTQESNYNQNVIGLTSEVASSLNELLLLDYLIKHAKTEEERQYYTAQQMSTLYSTFFVQTYYARFQEVAAWVVQNGGILTADKLDELWTQVAKECFGESYTLTDSDAGGWARIPHFYYGFYVYQYAVGIAAACNIADRIQSGDKSAVEDYLAFLKAGKSGNVVEMLNIAGVDIKNGDYISAFTARFDRLITELEEKK